VVGEDVGEGQRYGASDVPHSIDGDFSRSRPEVPIIECGFDFELYRALKIRI
jgi:hypothetical protein